MKESSEELIHEILQRLGEDPDREGLVDTPKRIVKSWSEIYAGYGMNVASIFTTFSNDVGYDQIILNKNIELYSTCEHHMIPFFGKAHIAYLPDKKFVGLSKLSRLLDIYAKRLQIQERIGHQVTRALEEYLQPKGAACIIEAVHMCTRMRGVQKQQSSMVTSSLTGVFKEDPAIRNELFQLIRMNDE